MSTISLFEQAQLAEAAYSDFSDPTKTTFDALTTGDSKFSTTQATEFLLHWRVVPNTHLPNTGSGFSATVFESLDHSGEFSLAIRGSLDPDDFIADTKLISTDGVAVTQLVDLYNYWQSLTHNGAYEAAKLTTQTIASDFLNALYLGSGANITAEVINLFTGVNVPTTYDAARAYFVGNGYVVEGGKVYTVDKGQSTEIFTSDHPLYSGSGKLIGEAVSVSGHSLGGHLAMAFSRVLPGFTNDVTSINGLGFKIGDANVNNLFAALGGANTFDASTIENVYGIAGFEFAAMNNSVLQQPGGWNGIFIEDGVGNALGHSTTQMTDSLAVADLFIRLDSSFSTQTTAEALTTLNVLFEKSSNQANMTLENLVSGLSQTIVDSKPTISTDDRESLYTAINNLANSTNFKSLLGKVTLAAPPTSALEARSDLGLFLSLYYLTPFALKTDGSIAADAQLTIAHPDLATQFKDDKLLTPEQIANGEANFSDMYLADRAAMLSWVIKRNKQDSSGIMQSYGQVQLFNDIATGTLILTGSGPLDRSQYVFGADLGANKNDNLSGSNQADHLYGMAGADTLNGGKGNDWLEGSEDFDSLKSCQSANDADWRMVA